MTDRYVSPQGPDRPGFDPRPLDRWAEGRQILGTRLEEFERLRGQPEALRTWLHDDANARALCRADVEPHLREWFTPSDGWLARPSYVPAPSGAVVPEATLAAVEWQWHGRHDKSYTFNNTLATGAEVVVRGCTVMALNEQKVLKVRRYIDWAGVLTQLGIGVNWRVPVGPAADART